MAESPQNPVFIRAVGTKLSREDRDYIRQRLARRLRKFDRFIERTSVRIEDINGPRGGVDKRCRVKVVLRGLPSVVVEEHHYSPRAAIDVAFDGIERTVRRAIERRGAKA
ncbi:MAG TPA: HPF/RaiA family ribosome-associated protein [Candidatus Binatia bacterium]|nr:HPF/RaiA family ribosome-associated protein [Candidatus Binatia bacterium]